jgi:hypothetical protein
MITFGHQMNYEAHCIVINHDGQDRLHRCGNFRYDAGNVVRSQKNESCFAVSPGAKSLGYEAESHDNI